MENQREMLVIEEKNRTIRKRSSKRKTKTEELLDLTLPLHVQTLSPEWRNFYAKVKKVVEE